MDHRRVLVLLAGVWVLCWTASARADRFIVRGVELTTPDEGWWLQEKGAVSDLVHENGGARIEVFRVKQVPAAETKAFAKWLRELKTTHPAEMEVTKAAEHEQHGLKGVMAEGTAKDADGKAVRLRILVLPMGNTAVVARAMIREEDAEELQKEVEEILGTMKPKQAAPRREQQRGHGQ